MVVSDIRNTSKNKIERKVTKSYKTTEDTIESVISTVCTIHVMTQLCYKDD